MGGARTVVLFLLAVWMLFLFVSGSIFLVREGATFTIILSTVAPLLSAFVLIYSALRWNNESSTWLVRTYAIVIGGLAVVGGLISLTFLALGGADTLFGDRAMSVAIFVAIVVFGAIMLLGTVLWRSPWARTLRAVGWALLLASNILIISFSFVTLPLIIGAAPILAKSE